MLCLLCFFLKHWFFKHIFISSENSITVSELDSNHHDIFSIKSLKYPRVVSWMRIWPPHTLWSCLSQKEVNSAIGQCQTTARWGEKRGQMSVHFNQQVQDTDLFSNLTHSPRFTITQIYIILFSAQTDLTVSTRRKKLAQIQSNAIVFLTRTLTSLFLFVTF